MKEIIKEWVAQIIESDPCRFGGDNGAVETLLEYLKIANPDCKISREAVKALTSVDRARRLVLAERPELDRRTSATKNNGGHIGRQAVIYDFIDDLEREASLLVSDGCLKRVREAVDSMELSSNKKTKLKG
ncbi:MAG: hypothetical protein DSY46_02850 [Hydrogenimonas sp.]|nr:MAG: hypothetical protein DSY46_02850 [Hydrogenimonas sp.]